MQDYSDIEGRSQNALLGFSVVMTNYNLAKSIGFANFTKESMAKAYTEQTVPVFASYAYSRASAPAGYPAIGNPYVKYVRYAGGKIENVQDGWTNSATGQTETKG
jgi:hypothetical protein